eukprot:3269913-Heterocapsa_arctica.AAC.1
MTAFISHSEPVRQLDRVLVPELVLVIYHFCTGPLHMSDHLFSDLTEDPKEQHSPHQSAFPFSPAGSPAKLGAGPGACAC